MSQDTDLTGYMAKIGLEKWYSSLSDRDKVRMERYVGKADTSSPHSFLLSVGSAALEDENYAFASTVLEECLVSADTDIKGFIVTELLIEACIGAKMYDRAKHHCENNLLLYPNVSADIKAMNNGSVPEKLNCRNRYVDIVVGIESGYDEAFGLLDRFLEMGLITKDDHTLRVQSLKIRRLQRSFDGVYTYTYKT